jgi:hypothetical protein
LKEIARIVGVSLSSVSLWVRDIDLDEVQQASMRSRAARRRGEASAAWARARRRAAQQTGRRQARRSDRLHLAGCMLFWAEGSRERNAVIFTNSDPAMVRYFARFLHECFAVPDEKSESRATSSRTTSNTSVRSRSFGSTRRVYLSAQQVDRQTSTQSTARSAETSSPTERAASSSATRRSSSPSTARSRNTPASTARVAWLVA